MEDSKNQMVDRFGSEEDEDTLVGKFLTFPLGKEEYGLEIRHVTEIVGIQKIHEVPDMPPYVQGVINLRQVFPVMDVHQFSFRKSHMMTRLHIEVNIGDSPVGLIVDTESEVISIR